MDWQARHDQLCACSLVDIFTSLKRRTTQPPTQALIQRKINSLSLPALETLSLSVENRIVSNHGSRRLSPLQIAGTARAVQFFPTETVAEIAHVHALGEVMSAAAVGSVHFQTSHLHRIGVQHLALAQKRGMAIHPIATDLHARAMEARNDGDSEKALSILGIEGAVVLEGGGFASKAGLLVGVAFSVAVMKSLDRICCGHCLRVVGIAEVSVCRRCGDRLICRECLSAGEYRVGHAGGECERIRVYVRTMAQSLIHALTKSARTRFVTVVQLDARGGIAPMHVSSMGSPLIRSSLLDFILRCPDVVCVAEVVVYWRLLIAFLAEPDGHEQVCIVDCEDVYHIKPAEHAVAVEKPGAGHARKAPTRPSEKRRLKKGPRTAEREAEGKARAVAEALAMEEANAVLERQAARPDATSAMLTSVLAKRESVASPEVVAHVRARRDSLRAAERMARKPASARPGRDLTERMCRRVDLVDARPTAALILQRRVRAWLRCRKKARRKKRSRAAKRIQSSVRTWLLLRVEVKSLIAATAASSGTSVGTDCEEPSVADAPESLKPASTEPTTAAECAICLDDDAEFAAVPCGHRCLCASCSKTVTHCPMCRAQMSAVLRIFI